MRDLAWRRARRAALLIVAAAALAAPAPALASGETVTPDPITATESVAFSDTRVGTFTEDKGIFCIDESAYSAQVDWNDGSGSSSAKVGAPVDNGTTCSYPITASHTFAEEGSYDPTIRVKDATGTTQVASASGWMTVSDQTFSSTSAGPVSAPVGHPFSGTVATFEDSADPAAVAGDYTATIAWGDGSTSPGTVGGSGTPFTVSGSHTYASKGDHLLQVTVTDKDSGSGLTFFGTASSGRGPQTFTVNSLDDASDASPGDGTCADAKGDCTLRAALDEANFPGQSDTTVNLPGGHYVLTKGQLLAKNDVKVVGAGTRTTTIDANHLSRVLEIDSGSVSLSELTITGGNASSGEGGGIWNQGSALSLARVAVTGNARDGGFGGGVSNDGDAASLVLTDSTISANAAASGGGVWNDGGTISVTNSTISANTASTSGGGVSSSFGKLAFLNATLDAHGSTALGAALALDGAKATIKNSIVAGGGSALCALAAGTTLTSQGHNLASDASCGFTNTGDRQNADPKLGPLQNNGGPTDTLALLAGSPAIDAGDSAGCPPADQRGIARPQGPACDIGAFELVPAPKPPPAAPPALAGGAVLGAVRTTSGYALVSLTCVGSPGQVCRLDGTLTTRERLRRGKVLGVRAQRRRRGRRARTATVGHAALAIPAGQTLTLKIPLNATGKRLLKRFKRLPATLTLTATAPDGRATVFSSRVAFRAKRGRRRHR